MCPCACVCVPAPPGVFEPVRVSECFIFHMKSSGPMRRIAILLLTCGSTYAFRVAHHPFFASSSPARTSTPTSSDAWLFTSIRDGAPEPDGADVPTLCAPFALPLWVGERRELRIRDPSEFKLLASLDVGGSFLFVPARTSSSVLNINATAARVLQLSPSRAVILGVGRRLIRAKVAERPVLMCRGPKLADSASADVGTLRKLKEDCESLWSLSLALTQRLRERQLAARLESLGGAASALLLSIPQQDQVELSRKSGRDEPPAHTSLSSSVRVAVSLEQSLEAGLELKEELERAAECVADEHESLPLLSVQSFVALRLASGCEDL